MNLINPDWFSEWKINLRLFIPYACNMEVCKQASKQVFKQASKQVFNQTPENFSIILDEARSPLGNILREKKKLKMTM